VVFYHGKGKGDKKELEKKRKREKDFQKRYLLPLDEIISNAA
jgi:hypothetical protein